MTRETLLLLRHCLCAQQLVVGAEDFAEVAQATVKALAELEAALAESEPRH